MSARRPGCAHRALPLAQLQHTAPQGRPEQGWPVRRWSPERFHDGYPGWQPGMACYDPEDDDRHRQPMDGWSVAVFLVLFIVSCAFAAWAYCVFGAQIKPVLVALLGVS